VIQAKEAGASRTVDFLEELENRVHGEEKP
jgi:hypothetical protein